MIDARRVTPEPLTGVVSAYSSRLVHRKPRGFSRGLASAHHPLSACSNPRRDICRVSCGAGFLVALPSNTLRRPTAEFLRPGTRLLGSPIPRALGRSIEVPSEYSRNRSRKRFIEVTVFLAVVRGGSDRGGSSRRLD